MASLDQTTQCLLWVKADIEGADDDVRSSSTADKRLDDPTMVSRDIPDTRRRALCCRTGLLANGDDTAVHPHFLRKKRRNHPVWNRCLSRQIVQILDRCKLLKRLAHQVGFEPTTLRLTG